MTTDWESMTPEMRRERARRHMGSPPDECVRIIKPAPKQSTRKETKTPSSSSRTITVRYRDDGKWDDLVPGKIYEVIAISLPVPKIPFFRIVDESEEDYLYPWDDFEIIEGQDLLDSFLSNPTPRETPIEEIGAENEY